MKKARPYGANSSGVELGTNGKLNRFVAGLNRLAEHQLAARARGEESQRFSLSFSQLATFGLTWEDCRELASRGLLASEGGSKSAKLSPSSPVHLTEAGFAFLQDAIPAGALRPAYDVSSRKLTVAGEVVIRLAVQARNQAAVLTAMEVAGWKSRVAEPLRERSRDSDGHDLAATTHNLNVHQTLIEFHCDDGAATWNWRPTSSAAPMRYGSVTRV